MQTAVATAAESPRWYVVKTKRNVEANAAQAIADSGFEVFLPKEARTRRHARRVETIIAPLITGYIFTRFSIVIDDGRWQRIIELDAVTAILGSRTGLNPMPTPIRQGEIEHLIAISQTRPIENSNQVPVLEKLSPGARIRIWAGVLENFSGFVLHDDRGRTLIQLDRRFGGRSISVPRESLCAEV